MQHDEVYQLIDAVNCLTEAKWRIDDAVSSIADPHYSDVVNSLFAHTKSVINSLEAHIATLQQPLHPLRGGTCGPPPAARRAPDPAMRPSGVC